MGCHFLLQGISLTQGSNLGLPHCRQTLYHVNHRQMGAQISALPPDGWTYLFPWNFSFLICYMNVVAAAAAKLLQSCPTLCDPIDGSPPGSAIPGILQARTPEWVAISFSNARKWKVKVKSLSCVWFLATPWIAAYQAPLSMGFSRQECWSGVPGLKYNTNSAWYLLNIQHMAATVTVESQSFLPWRG